MALGDKKVVNPFKPVINRLPRTLQNRYYIIILVFLLWMLFFDQADFYTQYKLSRTIKNLENDKIFYQEKLKEIQQQKLDMENDKEKFARERYYMKAADEDVFIVEQE